MMSFSKHAKGFPSSSDGHHFVRNMHEFLRENRFFVMFWGTCPIGLLTGMIDSSQATMDSPVTIGRGIIWTLRYRADTILSTNGQRDKVKPVYPQLCWSGDKNISVDVEDGDCETVGTVKQSRYSWLLYIYSGGLVVYLWCLKRATLSFDF